MEAKTKSLREIERKLEEVEEGSFRHEVLLAARRFKTSWIGLAQYLHVAKRDKLYRDWGFLTFEGYCSREIGIRRATASKLLLSYRYLAAEEPEFLDVEGVDPARVPSPEAVGVLRRAKKDGLLSGSDFQELRDDVLVEGKDYRDVYSRFKSLREEADPEAAARERRSSHLSRLIASLKSVRKEGRMLKVVPGALLKAIDVLIEKLSREMER